MPLVPAYSNTPSLSGSCEELLDAANATATHDIIARLTSSSIACDGWTTVDITTNSFELQWAGNDRVKKYIEILNVRFVVSSGVLRSKVPLLISPDETNNVSFRMAIGLFVFCWGGKSKRRG